MKNYLYLASIVSIILAACNQKQNSISLGSLGKTTFEDVNLENKFTYSNKLLREYQLYVSGLDSTDVKSCKMAAEKFKNSFHGKSSLLADSAFVIFNGLYEKLYRNLNEMHDKDTTNYDPLVVSYPPDIRPRLSENLLKYNRQLHENGFNVGVTEGMTYIQEDRDFISSYFCPLLSSNMKEYLFELNKENKEGFAEDAGLVISPQRLAERILWWERFIRQNPDFIFAYEARENKKYFLTFLMEGMDNTPILSDDQKSLDPEYKKAYQYIADSFPGSETNQIITPYFEALTKNNLALADRLLVKYRKDGKISNFGE